MSVRVANAAGRWDDPQDIAQGVVERESVDYVTLCYLPHLALPVLARGRHKDSQSGYVRQFADTLTRLGPAFFLQGQLKSITDAGGANPRACAERTGSILTNCGSSELPIAVVTGSDLRDDIEQLLRDGHALAHAETGQPFIELTRPVIAAHAWFGARPISDALASDARIVVTGPVGETASVVGLAAHEYRWKWDDWDRLAAATATGKLLAGGARLASGDPATRESTFAVSSGYPIADIQADGSATIARQVDSGGTISRATAVQQLIAGVRNPGQYETPDVNVDLGSTVVSQIAPDGVALRATQGSPATDSYDVSMTYQMGFSASALLLVRGRGAAAKAAQMAESLLHRVTQAGFKLTHTHVEQLGGGAAPSAPWTSSRELREVVLYLVAQDDRRAAIERWISEVARIGSSGPVGVAPLTAQPTRVEPTLAVWPTRVPKECVHPKIIVRSARQWHSAGR